MNMNEMQSVWNSPRNSLPAEELRRLVRQFSRQMIRRRRFQVVCLANTFFWLTLITVLAIWNIFAGKIKLGQEWGLFPILIVPWTFALLFLRRFQKPGLPMRGELPVADTVRMALSFNRAERSHLKLVGWLFAIMIPFLAVSMQQLQTVGKISSRELASMAVFFGGILLLSGAGIAARYFGRLLPQQRQLDALLAELNDEG